MDITKKDDTKRLTIEDTLYLIAFLLALIFRFSQLGNAPLSETEAYWANEALQISNGSLNLETEAVIQPAPGPAYTVLTSVLFSIFGANEFLARFWPALSGSLLVLAPLLIRKRNTSRMNGLHQVKELSTGDRSIFKFIFPFPRMVLIILSFGLAIDPGLVTVSRQAGGVMMALGFSILALASWAAGWRYLAGVFAGVALLTGAPVIPGIVGFTFSVSLVYSQLKEIHKNPDSEDNKQEKPAIGAPPLFRSLDFRQFSLAALITFFLVGTFFFRFPQGIAEWLASIQDYFMGWIKPLPDSSSGTIVQTLSVEPLKLVVVLLVYELFPLLFFLIGLVRSIISRNRISQQQSSLLLFNFAWAGISLLLVLAYPGRQVSDLVWFLVPMWLVAALELSSIYPFRRISLTREEAPSSSGMGNGEILTETNSELGYNSTRDPHSTAVAAILGGFIFILLALFWFTISAISQRNPSTALIDTNIFSNLRWLVPAGTLVLILLTTALVSLGWSARTGKQGFYWGIILALLVYNFSVLWGATYLRTNQPQEFWSQLPGTGQANLLLQTIDLYSKKETGFTGYLDILSTVNIPSMRWFLRDYQQSHFADEPQLGESPPVVITWADQEYPALSAAYSGQDFTWWRWPGWQGVIPTNILRWINYREAALSNQKIILWVRADLVQQPDEENLETGGTFQNEQP